MIYGMGRPMSLPFAGARATCPCNKINNKSISSNYHIAEKFWGNSSNIRY